MTKQELAKICIERLKAEYPASDCTLDYDHAWQLLVSVRLEMCIRDSSSDPRASCAHRLPDLRRLEVRQQRCEP